MIVATRLVMSKPIWLWRSAGPTSARQCARSPSIYCVSSAQPKEEQSSDRNPCRDRYAADQQYFRQGYLGEAGIHFHGIVGRTGICEISLKQGTVGRLRRNRSDSIKVLYVKHSASTPTQTADLWRLTFVKSLILQNTPLFQPFRCCEREGSCTPTRMAACWNLAENQGFEKICKTVRYAETFIRCTAQKIPRHSPPSQIAS